MSKNADIREVRPPKQGRTALYGKGFWTQNLDNQTSRYGIS